MADVEIKRGYEVLPDNRVRFGIRVINNEEFAISEVEVILDYNRALFELEGSKIEVLGTIPPSIIRTAKFILKPLGCIHNEKIGARVLYKDHKWENHTIDMRPKEVHCVCPFLKEKTITRTEFLKLFNEGYPAERGLNFENIEPEKLADFITHTCKNRLYKVDEFSIENGRILYLAGDSVGEKAHYLLTVVVIEREELVQVLFKAKSDKEFGINGFLNEVVENLRHLVQSSSDAKEIGIIKREQVINIIDSVVVRPDFGSFEEGNGKIEHKEKLRSQQEEHENLKKEKEENERLRKQREEDRIKKAEEERLHRQREEDERKRLEEEISRNEREEKEKLRKQEEVAEMKAPPKKSKSSSGKRILVSGIIFGILLIGAATILFVSNHNSDKSSSPQNFDTYTNSIGMEFVKIPNGEFMMGSNYLNDENPVHKVTIKDSYYLGKFEVTQKQWKSVMRYNKSVYKGDDLPVENVSWNEIQEFIKKLNQMEGTDKYRLPSEAEWEYACRAGTTTKYFFGDDELKISDYTSNSAVGKIKPNPWGLYNMYGNVWEWVQDTWHDNYDGAPSDGSAWESGSNSMRVIRGGDWLSLEDQYRSAYRNENDINSPSDTLGFRLAKNM